MRVSRCLLIVLVFPAVSLGMFAAEPVRIASHSLQIGFDPRSGQLLEFVDRASKQNLVSADTLNRELWALDFSDGKTSRSLKSSSAREFSFEKISDREMRLRWRDVAGVRVEATVALGETAALSRWGIVVEKAEGDLRKIRFPRLPAILAQQDERLAVPQWMGQLSTNPRAYFAGKEGKGRRLESDYPGETSMQCLAFYPREGPGLYVACNDTNAFRKTFAFFGDGHGNVGYEMVHLPENSARGSRYRLPYQAIIGTFRGDWITAAEIYRNWATNQYWAVESRLQRGLVPDWAQQTALWVWNRGRSPNVLWPAIALQKELGLPVSVFWHWWHGCAYDSGFPEYLPPREGDASFKDALAAAHRQNVRAIVYMNQRLWGMTTKSWSDEGAEKFAVKRADGKVRPEIYNTFTKAPCASMCMATGFWRNKYAGIAARALGQLGADGVYMDQACSSLACYDSSHGHPVGGGTYWMNGFRLLATDIRRRSSSQTVALAGEGVGESWLPYLDLMLSLQVSRERYAVADGWEPIPFFQAVYHPFAIQYGNYSSLTAPPYDELWPAKFAPKEPLKLLDRKFSRQFCLEQARAFVWGQQPTIANFLPVHLQERRKEIDYGLRLAKIRGRATKYLLRGTFLRAPELHAPETVVDMSRLSIYAGQKGGVTTFEKRVPLVIAGAWRAADGNVGVATASISTEPLHVRVDMRPSYYGLPSRGTVYRLDETGRQMIAKFDERHAEVGLELAPRAACVLEFAPE